LFGFFQRNNTAAWISQARGNVKKKKPRDSSSENSYCASISSNAEEYPTLEKVPYRQARTYEHNVDFKNIHIQPQYTEDVQSSVDTRDPRQNILNPLGARKPVVNTLAPRQVVSRENIPALRNMTSRNPTPIASTKSVPATVYVPHNMYQYVPPTSYNVPTPMPFVPVPSHMPYISPPTFPLSCTNEPSHLFIPSYNIAPYIAPVHVPTYNNVTPSFQHPPPQVIPLQSDETLCLVSPSKHNRTNPLPKNCDSKSFNEEIKLSYDSATVTDKETSQFDDLSNDILSLPQRQNKTTKRVLPNKGEI
jgi:hypothetical protein